MTLATSFSLNLSRQPPNASGTIPPMTIKAGNIKKGMYLLFKNQPHQVTRADFTSPGKGSAFMRARLKNVVGGSTQEFTYKSSESVEELEVNTQQMQFLYVDGDEAVFMDPGTYEQLSIDLELVRDKLGILVPELIVYVMIYNDKALGVSFPPKVKLQVTQADDAVAGNTVGKAMKEAEVETGMKLLVPLFISSGDFIAVDSDTLQYVSRVTE
jgi:elongation factor P